MRMSRTDLVFHGGIPRVGIQRHARFSGMACERTAMEAHVELNRGHAGRRGVRHVEAMRRLRRCCCGGDAIFLFSNSVGYVENVRRVSLARNIFPALWSLEFSLDRGPGPVFYTYRSEVTTGAKTWYGKMIAILLLNDKDIISRSHTSLRAPAWPSFRSKNDPMCNSSLTKRRVVPG